MKRYLIAVSFAACAAPAFADCEGGGTQVFYCDTENAFRVQVCLQNDTVQFRGGPDLSDPVYDLSMPVRFMPYLSTGIAQSKEDFSYIRFYEGIRVFTVGVDRDLEFASVSLGLAHDFLPANEEACNPDSIVDNFHMLDQFAHTTGRVAPVVSVPEVSPDCGSIHALRPAAEWMEDKDVSPIHLGPEEVTTEVIPVIRKCASVALRLRAGRGYGFSHMGLSAI